MYAAKLIHKNITNPIFFFALATDLLSYVYAEYANDKLKVNL
jgi:hypothetical protein